MPCLRTKARVHLLTRTIVETPPYSNFVFLKILFVHDLLYLILSLTCVYDLFINQPFD